MQFSIVYIFLNRYGEVKDVYIPNDFYTKKKKEFAYVQFLDRRDAEEAMNACNGRELEGRAISGCR